MVSLISSWALVVWARHVLEIDSNARQERISGNFRFRSPPDLREK
jgi:hypothetical protein